MTKFIQTIVALFITTVVGINATAKADTNKVLNTAHPRSGREAKPVTKGGVRVDSQQRGTRRTFAGKGTVQGVELIRRDKPLVTHKVAIVKRKHKRVFHAQSIVADEDNQTVVDAKAWRNRRGSGKFPPGSVMYDPR